MKEKLPYSRLFNQMDVEQTSTAIADSSTIEQMPIQRQNIQRREELGELDLIYQEKNFYVIDGEKHHVINKWNLSPQLRNISAEQLSAFLEKGYLRLNKVRDGEYTLQAYSRALGGGPIAGMIGYWATKALCYGGAVAAATTAVVATGGVAGAVGGGIAAGATAGATTGAAVVGGAIVGAGLGAEAAVVTSSVVATAGIAGTVAAIESAAASVGIALTALPFLP